MRKLNIQLCLGILMLIALISTSCQKENTQQTAALNQEVNPSSEELANLLAYKKAPVVATKEWKETATFANTSSSKAQDRADDAIKVLTCGAFEQNTTTGKGNSFTFSGNYYNYDGEDMYYALDVSAFDEGTYIIDLFGLSSDLDIFILQYQNGRERILKAGTRSGSAAERIIIDLPEGFYSILIDAYRQGISSPYKLTIRNAPSGPATPGDTFDDYNIGDKVADVSKSFLRFNPNSTDDAVVAAESGEQLMQVLPDMTPVMLLDNFRVDISGLLEFRDFKLKVALGKEAFFALEKSVKSGIAPTCIVQFARNGRIYIRALNRWHSTSKTYTPGEWVNVQVTHFSEGEEFSILINNEKIATLTSDIQLNATTSGSRDYDGISFLTGSRTAYQVDELFPSEVSPAGGASMSSKKTITLQIQ